MNADELRQRLLALGDPKRAQGAARFFKTGRGVALLIMVSQFPKAEAKVQKALYDLYVANTRQVNSWALVDCSAPHIVGPYLFTRSRRPLDRLAKSKNLWERRIAMVATQHF